MQENDTYYKYVHPRDSKYYGTTEYMTSCGDEFWSVGAGKEKVCVKKCTDDKQFLEQDYTCTNTCLSNTFKTDGQRKECVSACEKYYTKTELGYQCTDSCGSLFVEENNTCTEFCASLSAYLVNGTYFCTPARNCTLYSWPVLSKLSVRVCTEACAEQQFELNGHCVNTC